MDFKEKRLIYQHKGDSPSETPVPEEPDKVNPQDIPIENRIWEGVEDAGSWAARKFDDGTSYAGRKIDSAGFLLNEKYIDWFGPSPPDPHERVAFNDGVSPAAYFRALERAYFEDWSKKKKEEYFPLKKELERLKNVKKKRSLMVSRMKQEILSTEDKIERLKMKQSLYHRSEVSYRETQVEIDDLQKVRISLYRYTGDSKDKKVRLFSSFPSEEERKKFLEKHFIRGDEEAIDDENLSKYFYFDLNEPVSIDTGIGLLETALEPVEYETDYLYDNLKRSRFWKKYSGEIKSQPSQDTKPA